MNEKASAGESQDRAPGSKKRGKLMLGRWFVVSAIATVMVGAVAVLASHYVMFAVNLTTSLPEDMFLVVKGIQPKKGQLVAFYFPQTPYYPKNTIVIKIIGGVHGDRVSRKGREYYVNGKPIGISKRTSEKGLPLHFGPTGVLPKNDLFVYTPDKDSYDSRYKAIGWVPRSRVLGRAFGLF